MADGAARPADGNRANTLVRQRFPKTGRCKASGRDGRRIRFKARGGDRAVASALPTGGRGATSRWRGRPGCCSSCGGIAMQVSAASCQCRRRSSLPPGFARIQKKACGFGRPRTGARARTAGGPAYGPRLGRRRSPPTAFGFSRGAARTGAIMQWDLLTSRRSIPAVVRPGVNPTWINRRGGKHVRDDGHLPSDGLEVAAIGNDPARGRVPVCCKKKPFNWISPPMLSERGSPAIRSRR